jgi:hypothetical protein
MYCPNCATETSIDQKFCRVCGMNLSPVSQALSGQSLAPAPADRDRQAADDGDEMEDRRSKFMRRGFVLLFGGLVFTILMGVVGDEVQRVSGPLGHMMKSLAGLGAAGLLAGVGLIIYAGLLPSFKLRQQPRRRSISPPAAIIDYPDGRINTASMEPEGQSTPSVTEHTTYTLDPQKSDPASRLN